VAGHRAVGHWLEPADAHLWICENQAGRRSSRSTSVFTGNGAFGILQREEHCVLAFAPLGHGIRPGPLEDPVIAAIAGRVGKTPAQVLLAWAVQRGTALLTTPRTAARARENFNISPLPEDALDEINRIQTQQRLNDVVKTGSPGFIPQGAWIWNPNTI
jgi:diketogulonate reductase-like aldo/keto reductase